MKVVGIDYGAKNLGFAVANTPYATLLPSLKVESMDDAVAESLKLLKSINPDYIVVGIPETGPMIQLVEEYVKLLQKTLTCPISTHEETLTTKDAINKLRSIKASKTKLMQDHSYAACLILEDYLDLNPDLVKL